MVTMKIIDKFKEKINGVLTAFDRIIIKGHIRNFFSESGKMYFLSKENVLLKNFGDYAEKITRSIKDHVENIAESNKRPLIYLNSSKISKEETALDVLKKDPVDEGLICILSTVEMCNSIEIKKNRETHKLEATNGKRKCLYYYFYFLDREFGFMHIKLQTWFPFEIQVYINGREYIAKQLDKKNIEYTRYDNCFLQISDIDIAQKISDDLIKNKRLNNMLDCFAGFVNPFIYRIEEVFNCGYFWCIDQCEYATDVMFKSCEDLKSVYEDFVNHAILSFKYDDVMTFVGRKVHHAFSGEVVSDIKKRPYGVRIKHRMKKNSIKMYDKHSVLRVETTINQPKEFKIYKKGEDNNIGKWVPMGKSIANFYRYAEVSKASNKRYLDAVALADLNGECIDEIEKICTSVKHDNRQYSSFNPISKETATLFRAVLQAGNYINGLTNASIRKYLFPDKFDDVKIRNKITRIIAKLRAHKLISKIPHSNRYKITSKGIRVMTATLSIKNLKMIDVVKAS